MCVEHPSTEQIFSAAAEIADPVERAAYLDDVCATDPALRLEIEDLLRRDAERGDFLRSCSPELPVSAAVQRLLNEGPGTTIGRYSLIELLGEGGFGDVYVAEQQEPVRRQVALKVIKLGMDTRQVVARFEAERQALALLDHPNIAKVYDAGTTETGRPFFVMELCQGAPITKYSDDNRLTTRERLALVIDVCHAIHHAHETGIIHRDIKPTNVLVICYDDRPVPKLIDFGIAKAIQQRLTEETFATRAGQFVGTPQYISPEQAGMTDHGVDMRTDIYSLGVLLYELLTGTTPFEPDQLQHAGYDEICRSIRDIDPPRPSKRVSTLAFSTTDVFAHRQTQPSELRRQLRGDLDSIVMKALEKDSRDRYSSAEELADDLLRHLQNRPIRAKKASLSNRISKWSRRHESVVWSAAAILVVTLIALAGTTVLTTRALNRESVQRQIAEKNEQRAQQSEERAREFVETMVNTTADQLRWGQHVQQTQRELLEYARISYEDEIHRNSSDPALRHKTALIWRSLGMVHAALGDYSEADEAFRHAIEVLSDLASKQPTVASLRIDLARSHDERGHAQASALRRDRATAEYRSARTLWQSLSQQFPEDATCRHGFLATSAHLAIHQMYLGRLDDAVECLTPALAATTHDQDASPLTEEGDDAVANVHASYGRILARRYELSEAKPHLVKALHITQRMLESQVLKPTTLLFSLGGDNTELGWVASLKGDYAEAARRFGEAVRNREELAADFPQNNFLHRLLAINIRFLSEALLATGQRADAEAALERNREITAEWTAKLSDNQHNVIELGTTYYRLGTLWHDEGREEEAQDAMTKARELLERVARAPSQLLFPNRRLVLLLSTCPLPEFRDPSRGLELARELTADEPQDGRYWQLLGVAQYEAGHFRDAIQTLEKSRRLRSGGDRFDRVFLAMSHWQLGAEETARRWLDEAADEKLGGPAMNNDFTTLDLQRFRSEAERLINGSAEPRQTPDTLN